MRCTVAIDVSFVFYGMRSVVVLLKKGVFMLYGMVAAQLYDMWGVLLLLMCVLCCMRW